MGRKLGQFPHRGSRKLLEKLAAQWDHTTPGHPCSPCRTSGRASSRCGDGSPLGARVGGQCSHTHTHGEIWDLAGLRDRSWPGTWQAFVNHCVLGRRTYRLMYGPQVGMAGMVGHPCQGQAPNTPPKSWPPTSLSPPRPTSLCAGAPRHNGDRPRGFRRRRGCLAGTAGRD